MGIERLTAAARAAGYAMATSEELLTPAQTHKSSNPWRVAVAQPLSEARRSASSTATYVARAKEMFGLLTGRVTA